MQNLPSPVTKQSDKQNAPEALALTTKMTLTKEDMTIWAWLVSKGIANAVSGLSEMVGHEIRVTSLDLKWLPVGDVAVSLGGTEAPGVGIYLSIQGDATGHLLLVHDLGIAFQLVDLQLDLPPGSTQRMGEIERCALADIGNITGTYFLNTLADSANLVLMPSPPSVIVDSVLAILNVPLEYIGEKQDNALVVKATFSAENRQMDGAFIVLPTIDFMVTVLRHSRK